MRAARELSDVLGSGEAVEASLRLRLWSYANLELIRVMSNAQRGEGSIDIERLLPHVTAPDRRELGTMLAVSAAMRGEMATAAGYLNWSQIGDDAEWGHGEVKRTSGRDRATTDARDLLRRWIRQCQGRDVEVQSLIDPARPAQLPGRYGLSAVRAYLDTRQAVVNGHVERLQDRLGAMESLHSPPWFQSEAFALRLEAHASIGAVAKARLLLSSNPRRISPADPALLLAKAKVELRAGNADEARSIARELERSGCCIRHRTRASVLVWVSEAVLRGDVDKAQSQSIQRACREHGLMEPFTDVPSAMRSDIFDEGASALRPMIVVPAEAVHGLSKREQIVVDALASIDSIGELAEMLHVSRNTIKTQLRHIYRKLGVNSREQAIRAVAGSPA
ncbi:response regulator transcription factor [Microbacterium sp. A84]|uniref:helix-turn-helix transcriptional regulator n=1 Tax=Microbacterium sp. A84 TaxID=3450715 RepID=UPI003F4238F9